MYSNTYEYEYILPRPGSYVYIMVRTRIFIFKIFSFGRPCLLPPTCKHFSEDIVFNLQKVAILSLSFFFSSPYLKNGLTDSIQIWHMVVTSFEGVPYFKVTLNSYV